MVTNFKGSKSAPLSYKEIIDVLGELPSIVREKRRREQLSLREAARQLGMSFSTVSRIENGEDGSLSNTVKVLMWVGGLT
jgi:ribosome-binding protein aMBF1 (putative translation factor)